MKKFFEISLLLFLSVALCACPYSSAYNIDEVPGIYVEDALLGKWATYVKSKDKKKEEAVYLTLTRHTDTEYNIAFSGNLDALKLYKHITSDSLAGTAFMSTIGNRQFCNIKINARIYIAELIIADDNISLLPLAEHFTSKMIFSSKELRSAVHFHYKTRVHPVIDEDFCLRNMTKIN